MCGFHITAWMRRARDEGRLPDRTYVAFLEEHLQEVCAGCRQEAEAHLKGAGAVRRAEVPPVGEAQRAAKDLEALLALPVEERIGAVSRARRRYKGPLLARLLVDRSFACLPHDLRGSLEYATLAVAVVEGSGQRGTGNVHVLALGYQGNALRALGRLAEAARCFEYARRLIRHGIADGESREVIADVHVYGKLAWFEGLYRRERGEWDAAEEQLNRSVLFFMIAGDSDSVHRVVLSLAELYVYSGNVTDALEAVTTLLDHLSERDEPQLYWIARFNYAFYLVEAELHELAKQELAACVAARGFRRSSFIDRRVAWLGGRIDRELGDLAAAERKLTSVRTGYLEEGSALNTALASLDLTLVYLAQGRTSELKQVAEELTVIFGSNEVHREALAALMLFQEAVRQEQVTAGYLGRLRTYLERSRYQPGLPFEKPS